MNCRTLSGFKNKFIMSCRTPSPFKNKFIIVIIITALRATKERTQKLHICSNSFFNYLLGDTTISKTIGHTHTLFPMEYSVGG